MLNTRVPFGSLATAFIILEAVGVAHGIRDVGWLVVCSIAASICLRQAYAVCGIVARSSSRDARVVRPTDDAAAASAVVSEVGTAL